MTHNNDVEIQYFQCVLKRNLLAEISSPKRDATNITLETFLKWKNTSNITVSLSQYYTYWSVDSKPQGQAPLKWLDLSAWSCGNCI